MDILWRITPVITSHTPDRGRPRGAHTFLLLFRPFGLFDSCYRLDAGQMHVASSFIRLNKLGTIARSVTHTFTSKYIFLSNIQWCIFFWLLLVFYWLLMSMDYEVSQFNIRKKTWKIHQIDHFFYLSVFFEDDASYNPCQDGSNIYFYADPTDSSKYYQCDESGNAYLRSCGNLVWDELRVACNWPAAVAPQPPRSI
jgi:hypothetical protein